MPDTLTTPYSFVAQRSRMAAHRARVIAEIARDRFAPPAAFAALQGMAALLDVAAAHFDAVPPNAPRELPTEATEALFLAEQVAVDHPAARFPAELGEYVLAPLVNRPLPLPAPLKPRDTGRFAQREADLIHALHLLHADGTHQQERPADWLRQVFTVWRDWMRLEGEIREDNARARHHR
ncbi:hypothetical protein ABZ687_29070 [Streptomyces ardesiacus]|uniref:hypothetical protein n=1 Tax=Streptomyces ardesiacus TaxID=285564 RepID=UPI003407B3F6